MSILINAYSTVTNPPDIHFQCNHLHQRGLADPEFIDHLDGFIGFVLSAGDEQMNARRYALWRHIQKLSINSLLKSRKKISLNLPFGHKMLM